MKQRTSTWATWVVGLAVAGSSLGCDDLQAPGAGTDGTTTTDGGAIVQTYPPAGAIAGGTTDVFGTKVKSWATADATGKLQTVSWTFPLSILQSVPPGTNTDIFILGALPDIVGKQSIFRNLMLNFLPHGHVPAGVYDVPHWEFHLFTPPDAQYQSIDCSDTSKPPDDTLPPRWFLAPAPNNCNVQMGVHAFSIDLPELNQARFTHSVLLSYYFGGFIAYEPQATLDWWAARTSFTLDLPDMRLLGKDTLYPTIMTANYDQKNDLYVVSFDHFVGLKD